MYVVYQLMYEIVYGKTPNMENAVTLPLDVDRPCFFLVYLKIGHKLVEAGFKVHHICILFFL